MTDNPSPSRLFLADVIERLKREPADKRVPLGFGSPHSYRGYYEELAFEPAQDVTVGHMLAAAESALGKTFQGWKGGDYVMDQNSIVWLAEEGSSGETLGALLLESLLSARSASSPEGYTPTPGKDRIALLRRAAEGRREYAAALREDEPNSALSGQRDALLAQAAALESAAKIMEGDNNPLYGLVPSWRWTDEEVRALETPGPAPVAPNLGAGDRVGAPVLGLVAGVIGDHVFFEGEDAEEWATARAYNAAQALIDKGWLDKLGPIGPDEPVASTLRRVIEDIESEADTHHRYDSATLLAYAARLRKHPALLAGDSTDTPAVRVFRYAQPSGPEYLLHPDGHVVRRYYGLEQPYPDMDAAFLEHEVQRKAMIEYADDTPAGSVVPTDSPTDEVATS